LSEQGWRGFIEADGLDDWVVLHGGPTAVFVTKHFAHSGQLANAFAQLPALHESAAHISILNTRVTVRLTREIWVLEAQHIDLARQISAIAESLGATASPAEVQEVQVAIAAKADAIDMEFWRSVLGYDPISSHNARDPLGTSSAIWMQEIAPDKALKHAMHIDVSVSKNQIEARLAAVLAAGGVMVDDSNAPAWWILADRSGNKVCIVSWPDGTKEH